MVRFPVLETGGCRFESCIPDLHTENIGGALGARAVCNTVVARLNGFEFHNPHQNLSLVANIHSRLVETMRTFAVSIFTLAGRVKRRAHRQE